MNKEKKTMGGQVPFLVFSALVCAADVDLVGPLDAEILKNIVEARKQPPARPFWSPSKDPEKKKAPTDFTGRYDMPVALLLPFSCPILLIFAYFLQAWRQAIVRRETGRCNLVILASGCFDGCHVSKEATFCWSLLQHPASCVLTHWIVNSCVLWSRFLHTAELIGARCYTNGVSMAGTATKLVQRLFNTDRGRR